jgi:hypothetical protein
VYDCEGQQSASVIESTGSAKFLRESMGSMREPCGQSEMDCKQGFPLRCAALHGFENTALADGGPPPRIPTTTCPNCHVARLAAPDQPLAQPRSTAGALNPAGRGFTIMALLHNPADSRSDRPRCGGRGSNLLADLLNRCGMAVIGIHQ